MKAAVLRDTINIIFCSYRPNTLSSKLKLYETILYLTKVTLFHNSVRKLITEILKMFTVS